MKMRKILLMAMVFGLFIVFSASESVASVWAVCTVTEAGQSTTTGDVYVKLDEVSDANWTGERYYVCTGAQKNAVLATALTAVSSGYKVNVKLTNYGEWNIVESFYCQNQ